MGYPFGKFFQLLLLTALRREKLQTLAGARSTWLQNYGLFRRTG